MVKTLNTAEYLSRAMDLSGRSQREIADEVGYPKPNILSMMKLGQTKVPIDRIPALARACGVDEKQFGRTALREYLPETYKVVTDNLGEILSANEKALLEAYREVAPNSEIDIDFHARIRVQDALTQRVSKKVDSGG